MKDQILNQKVNEILTSFENLENIRATEEWNQTMMKRLATSRKESFPPLINRKYAVALIMILLFNIGFILIAVNGVNNKVNYRYATLKTISNDFLINPGSVSN